MPDLPQRPADNVPGRFYVDDTCINCGLCPAHLPAVFRETDDATRSYVYAQPTNNDDTAAAVEAVQICPTNSIVDTGRDVRVVAQA